MASIAPDADANHAASYKNMNGYNLATYGETVYEYPEGKFTYGKFYLKSIEYD